MSLRSLLNRKRLTLLGLNAGTSADGLDLALVTVDRSRRKYRVTFRTGGRRKYPARLRREVLALADEPRPDLETAIRLDQALGRFYGRAARNFLKKQNIRVDAVASHGQTVRHLPERVALAGSKVAGTSQLGSPEQIARLTGLAVIADFRQADIAAGGEGAPITTAAVARLFADRSRSRLIVNIGGMSNYFYLPAGKLRRVNEAADCGPGNVLSDLCCQALFDRPYDRFGRIASDGQLSRRLLELLLAQPFFRGGKISTGREMFGRALIGRVIAYGRDLKLPPKDIQATTAELTPLSIVARIRPIIKRDRSLDKLYLTGGGCHNRFFVRRLQELLEGLTVTSVDELGFDPDLLEATSFAVLGEACLRSEGIPVTTRRGRRRSVEPVAGRVVQPPV